MNRFLRTLERARANGWCTRPRCTTCDAVEFGTALRESAAAKVHPLADALASVDLTMLEGINGWQDAIRLALDELSDAALMDQVLSVWLPQIDEHIRLADLVVFYYARRGALFAPMSIELVERWVSSNTCSATRRFALEDGP